VVRLAKIISANRQAIEVGSIQMLNVRFTRKRVAAVTPKEMLEFCGDEAKIESRSPRKIFQDQLLK